MSSSPREGQEDGADRQFHDELDETQAGVEGGEYFLCPLSLTTLFQTILLRLLADAQSDLILFE